ncbi:MAG: B12-binding domain-containing radical SAM protein [Desulfobaccales bacterium]
MMQSKDRILLIEPPFNRLHKNTYSLNRLPLSLAYLAGVIKKHTDWDVMVYNADFISPDEPIVLNYITGAGFQNYLENLGDPAKPIWQEIRKTIADFAPSLVGISSKSQNFLSATRVAQLVKSVNKDIVVVIGGPHPSLQKAEALKEECFDIGVFGEGEITILEVLQAQSGDKALSEIPGIAYREGGKVVINSGRELIQDIDTLPFPISTAPEVLKDYSKYPKEAFRYIFATRGCPYNCSFCGSRYIWTRKPRFRSVENILREIKELQKLGINWIHFDDDTFGIKRSFIKELANGMMRQCPDMSWSCEMHVKLVDPEIISLMKKAGCKDIQMGIESGNNAILKEIRKGITIEGAINAAQIIKRANISLELFFMVGFPQETEETLNDTFKAIKNIPCDNIIYSIFTPYPGTELFNYCKQEGIIPDDFDVSMCNHQSPINYFSPKIQRDKFYTIVRHMEREIDRLNSYKKLKRIFSYETYLKIKHKGIRKSLSRLSSYLYELFRIRK